MKLDNRRKYYLILDCETATLPCAMEYPAAVRKNIAIAKPLIYDFAWKIVDKLGRVYCERNFLISEIFSVPDVFNTAYYAEKRPLYLEMLARGEITLTDWRTATAFFEEDLNCVCAVGAYNSMFDYKKAIPFTETYINNLYSIHYQTWYARQREICDTLANGRKPNNSEFNGETFTFRENEKPLFDIWGMACTHLLNNDDYRSKCLEENWITESGKFYKTSAETAYRFVMGDDDFIEAHTALDDVTIETLLFSQSVKKARNKVEPMGIVYFPFRIVGKIE